ncbi:MAG: cell division protein ZipA C-terminal FtsZ-binding domain-containing protein [Steroidobacter sp.]
MTLSTQLRLIILAAGALLLVVIYLLGRRRSSSDEEPIPRVSMDKARKSQRFEEVSPLVIDEDEYDEPSYLRRSTRRDQTDAVSARDDDELLTLPPVYIEPPVVETVDEEPVVSSATMRVPVLSMQDPNKTIPMKVDAVLPSSSNVEVVNQSVTAPQSTKPGGQRQLIALRLSMSERVSGEQLLAMFQAERLQHGKFNIFHRLHKGETVFSVASMTEPGSFDLATMPSQQYPGISLFMLLPGPLAGMDAFEEMISCAQRLAQLTSGVVQDESSVMLLESGIERLRDKVRDFERSLQA